MNSIPTVYNASGICSALFGENARHFSPPEYGNAVILDASAALILTEKGVDVGIESRGAIAIDDLGSITDAKTGMGGIAMGARIKRLCGKFNANIEEVLTCAVGGKSQVLAYRYENAQGQRFLVFTYFADELRKNPTFLRSYEIHTALVREIQWISKKSLPIIAERAPELYTLCEKCEDHTSALLCNCFFDAVLTPTITLDREYSHVQVTGGKAHMEGNRVVFESDIPAFDFVSFKAYN